MVISNGDQTPTDDADTPEPSAPAVRRANRPWVVAALALVIAVASVGLTLYTLGQARTANDNALEAHGQAREARALVDSVMSEREGNGDALPEGSEESEGGSSPPSETEQSSTDEPEPPDEDPPDVLNPQATYVEAYAAESLTVSPPVDSGSTTVDLDEPRIGVTTNAADAELRRRSDVLVFEFEGGVTVAEAATSDLTPEECAERMRTAPLAAGESVPTQRGVVLCVATSSADARELGISQKIVVIEITGVADDGRVTIRLTAWEVPV